MAIFLELNVCLYFMSPFFQYTINTRMHACMDAARSEGPLLISSSFLRPRPAVRACVHAYVVCVANIRQLSTNAVQITEEKGRKETVEASISAAAAPIHMQVLYEL